MALCVGVDLPVKVVQQPGQPPDVSVTPIARGIGAQGRLHALAMADQGGALHILM
jgi:hypothetical protein